jgi:hypothetical protein
VQLYTHIFTVLGSGFKDVGSIPAPFVLGGRPRCLPLDCSKAWWPLVRPSCRESHGQLCVVYMLG